MFDNCRPSNWHETLEAFRSAPGDDLLVTLVILREYLASRGSLATVILVQISSHLPLDPL